MTNRFDAVIFDLGRVLVALDLSAWTDRLFTGRDPKDVERTLQQIMSEDVVYRFFIGAIDGPQFHREMAATYGVQLSYDEFVCVWHDIFKPMPGMDRLVEQVGRSCRLGLLSDTDPIHWRFLLANYPILRHFKNPTLSFRVGAMKPDPRMYLAAAAAVETAPERCFYIDDLPRNVEGARKAGMTAVQFQNPEILKQTLEEFGII